MASRLELQRRMGAQNRYEANKFTANGSNITILALYWLRCKGSEIPELL